MSGTKPPTGPPNFFDAMRAMNEREDKKAETIGEIFEAHQIPTSQQIRNYLVAMPVTNFHKVMRLHPFFDENQLRLAVHRMIDVVEEAHLDFCQAEARLVAVSQRVSSDSEFPENSVEVPAQKEVLAFCVAMRAIADVVKALVEEREDIAEAIQQLHKQYTDTDEMCFLSDLRNSMVHGRVTFTQWNARTDSERSDGEIHLERDRLSELFNNNRTSKRSKQFVAKYPTARLPIRDIFNACILKIGSFRVEFDKLLRRHTTEAEQDYFDIMDARESFLKKQFGKMLIEPRSKGGYNPYDYLDFYFTDREIREIRRLPDNSAEQIEFMISLRAAEIKVDDQLRSYIYRWFGVEPEGNKTF